MSKHVIVVTGDPEYLKYVSLFLEDVIDGVEVGKAEDVSELIAMASEKRPDLVFLGDSHQNNSYNFDNLTKIQSQVGAPLIAVLTFPQSSFYAIHNNPEGIRYFQFPESPAVLKAAIDELIR